MRRCPLCGRPLSGDEPFDAPTTLREAFIKETAPVRARSILWMALVTSVLAAAAVGSMLHHRDAGAVVAAAACAALSVALWCGWLVGRRHGPR